MKILGIETATGSSSVALVDSRRLVTSARRLGTRGHGSFLVPAIDFCFEQAGWRPEQLDAVVVDVGPGLFTGIRVGVATAQGLAASLGVPVLGASSLDALAVRATTGHRYIWSMVDVRRGEVAVAGYRPVPGGVALDSPSRLVGYDHVRGMLESSTEPVLMVGEWEVLPSSTRRSLRAVRTGRPVHPEADALIEVAWPRIERGEFDNPRDVRPVYMRAPDVTLGSVHRRDGGLWVQAGEVLIRDMTVEDLDQVLELEAETFQSPWTRSVFEEELATDGRTYLVAEMAGIIVGFGGLMLVGGGAHVNTLAARRPSRPAAVGTRLMLEMVARGLDGGAEHLTLEVRASNHRAQDFYRKFGMAPVGVRKHYYQDEDALVMWVHDIRSSEFRDRIRLLKVGLP